MSLFDSFSLHSHLRTSFGPHSDFNGVRGGHPSLRAAPGGEWPAAPGVEQPGPPAGAAALHAPGLRRLPPRPAWANAGQERKKGRRQEGKKALKREGWKGGRRVEGWKGRERFGMLNWLETREPISETREPISGQQLDKESESAKSLKGEHVPPHKSRPTPENPKRRKAGTRDCLPEANRLASGFGFLSNWPKKSCHEKARGPNFWTHCVWGFICARSARLLRVIHLFSCAFTCRFVFGFVERTCEFIDAYVDM